MNLSERYPLLSQLFGAYFHQDWKDLYGSPEMVIKAYVDDGELEEAMHAAQELEKLISLGMSETELEKVVYDEFGSYYHVPASGKTMSEWLRWVRETLAKYAAEKLTEEK